MHEVEQSAERPEMSMPQPPSLEASYNDYLHEKIQQMFRKDEALAFMQAAEKQRPTAIRVNTLVDRPSSVLQKLAARGVNLEEVSWCPAAAVVYESDVPVGATPEYLSGMYTIQGVASMLSVVALDPQPGEVVVDMCAAPGGKSTHIAARMKNTGTLYANDISKERVAALSANVQRMGVSNAICLNMDALNLPFERVNRVLLDAPCSGTGVISKDPSVKRNKSEEILHKIQMQQKKLILKAFDMLDPRHPETSTLVYSTCSFLVEENECVVDYLLRKRKNAKIVDTGLATGKEGFKAYRGWIFHPSLALTRRYFPHIHNLDGFFIAKIQKKGYTHEEVQAIRQQKIDAKKKPVSDKENAPEKTRSRKPANEEPRKTPGLSKKKEEQRKKRDERREKRKAQRIEQKRKKAEKAQAAENTQE